MASDLAAGVNAIAFANSFQTIQSCSKKLMIACFKSMNVNALRFILLTVLSQSKFKSMAESTLNKSLVNIDNVATDICNHFNKVPSKTSTKKKKKINKKNKFTSLPSDIGASVISFFGKTDKFNAVLVSIDLYKFCQHSIANRQLFVDRSFCEAIYENTVDYQKYFNLNRLDVQFAFVNSKSSLCQYCDFENKYYSVLGEIISHSSSLQTINYDLKHYQARSTLDKKRIKETYSGKIDDFPDWMKKIKKRLPEEKQNVFDTMTAVHWRRTDFYKWRNGEHHPRIRLATDVMFFVNVKKLILRRVPPRDDKFCILFQNDQFQKNLEHLEMDTAPVCDSSDLKKNPLWNIFKFNRLQTLKLTLFVGAAETCDELSADTSRYTESINK